jgi:predicted XRE-type DNA-binding protein
MRTFLESVHLMRGKIHPFGLDALVNMATAAGLHIEMRVLEAA